MTLRRTVLGGLAIAAALLIGVRALDDLRDPGEEVGIFFPRMPAGWEGPAALQEGQLALRNSCLWLDTERESYLLLWPAGSRPIVDNGVIRVLSADGRHLATVGERVAAGGGELRDTGTAVRLVGRAPPEECRRGLYWRSFEIKELGSR